VELISKHGDAVTLSKDDDALSETAHLLRNTKRRCETRSAELASLNQANTSSLIPGPGA
jgi:hypothetical protein